MSREIETLIKLLESRLAEMHKKSRAAINCYDYSTAKNLKLKAEGIAEALEIVRKWVD